MLVVIARRAALAATCLALLTACGSGDKGADRCSTWAGPIFGVTSPHVHGSVRAPGTDTAGAPCQFDLYQGILDGWILDQPGSFSATRMPPGVGINNTLVRCRDGVSTGDQGIDWCQTGAATLGATNSVALTVAGP